MDLKKELTNAAVRIGCHGAIAGIRGAVGKLSGKKGNKFVKSEFGKGLITTAIGLAAPRITNNETVGVVSSEARILGLVSVVVGAVKQIAGKEDKTEDKKDSES